MSNDRGTSQLYMCREEYHLADSPIPCCHCVPLPCLDTAAPACYRPPLVSIEDDNHLSFTHTYIGKLLIAVDMLACSIIWRDSGITISSMTGLALRQWQPPRWARVLGWILNHIEANHTLLAIADDITRANAALAILWGKT